MKCVKNRLFLCLAGHTPCATGPGHQTGCVTFSLKAVEFSLMPLADTRDEVLTLLPPPPKLEDTRDVVLLLLPPLS